MNNMKTIEEVATRCNMQRTQSAINSLAQARKEENERVRVMVYAPNPDLLADVLTPLGGDQKYTVTQGEETMQMSSALLHDLLRTNGEEQISVRTQLDGYDLHCTTSTLSQSQILTADKVVFVVDAAHALDSRQQGLLNNLRTQVSVRRLYLDLCNVCHVPMNEWDALVQRLTLYAPGVTICASAPDGISPVLLAHIRRQTPDLHARLQQDTTNTLEVRRQTHVDTQEWVEGVFQTEASETLQHLQAEQRQLLSRSDDCTQQVATLTRARQDLLQRVDLFINDAMPAQLIMTVNEFASSLRESLKKDIQESKDIKKESRYLNPYLTYVWRQFLSQYQATMLSKLARQLELLDTQMNADLLASNGEDSPQHSGDHNAAARRNYSTNVRVSRRRSGYGLSSLGDTVNLAGLVAMILAGVSTGLPLILGGVVMKRLMKGRLTKEFKQDMEMNVDVAMDRIVKGLEGQMAQRYHEISDTIRAEYAQHYDQAIAAKQLQAEEMKQQAEEWRRLAEELLLQAEHYEAAS